MLCKIEDLEIESAETTLAVMGSISRRYEKYLLHSKDAYVSRPAGIHASEVSPCPRKAVYTMRGVEKKVMRWHTRWRKRFEHGHFIHDMLQRNFGNMAKESGDELVFYREVEITPKTSDMAERYDVYSHCDGVLEFYRRGTLLGRMCLEIKSMSPGEFAKLKKPKTEHIEQAHVYMACLDLPVTWFLYFNKGNEVCTPSSGKFLVPFNRTLWDTLEQRFDGWFDAVESDVLPDRVESIVCEFCPYDWTCLPKYNRRYKNKTKNTSITRLKRR